MTEVAPAVAGTTDVPSDAVLIQAVRGGDIAAYGQLYDRHLVAARRVAAAIASDAAERDDLIAEGFTRVLRILRTGEGPDEEFRPYLLTTIRNTMISWRRRDSAVSLVAEVPDVLPGEGSDEPVDSRLHGTVAADAFASLPKRWRTVLWRTEIEGESPARIAEDLGMTPNGVAALAYRAREGLRQAYLDQHVPAARRRNCRIVSGQLARWVRDGVGDHKAHRITTHLDRCADCRKLATGLRELNAELPAAVAPLILGIPVATHWLTATGSLASSGAATSTGASVLSWATAAKVAAASAALVTTVTIGASTSDSTPPAAPGADGATEQPVPNRPAAGVPAGGDQRPTSGAQLTSAPPAPESSAVETAAGEQTGASGTGGTATNDKQAAKESKQAAKESKQAAKESKQAAKESKKAGKTTQPGG
ncbi:sigma-70 family RNA polymerase sigma factor [Amycolatopsis mongoliensis]|uniref:Sigma-70 family RNA polymerase sigma factor n=1 Tax=Amycolatopsis mongoliensis TaxID=715475 RepID=A0A9Y2JL93_9PSEU|nr:sigma-70 family RNA polymerase sigma factor [Amycolatopsis sp. 4-36]WIY00575.1 sigma-70 family RNA polymerase sigma factor [Amycolatopsis sp. 4-36]